MKIVGTALAFTSMAAYASAFAPNAASSTMTSLGMSDEAVPAPAEMKQWPEVNGWGTLIDATRLWLFQSAYVTVD